MLLEQPGIKAAAVDYEKGLAYVLPEGDWDDAQVLAALRESGKYSARVQ